MAYTLADLELHIAERRLTLQAAALDVREQWDKLRVETEPPAEDPASNQPPRRLWWRYY